MPTGATDIGGWEPGLALLSLTAVLTNTVRPPHALYRPMIHFHMDIPCASHMRAIAW